MSLFTRSLTAVLLSVFFFGTVASAEEIAVIETRFGKIEIAFFADKAPGHVKNFTDLARKEFYDGTSFHRVIPGFMIQGGDSFSKTEPGNRGKHGMGGPGYTIKEEFNDTRHVRGILSMARSQDPDSAGSQFFIVMKDSFFLDNKYTAFGKVISGMDVADKIVDAERDDQDNPLERIEMNVKIETR
ncbi:MAG: peptidylprolyl isomerase [Nitrospinae bacterium]|nr:peptidylprolyl isomerase [Nitrospinota bacterium]